MKGLSLGIATVTLLSSAPWANAQISYSYLHASFIVSEADTALGEQDGTGPQLGISYEVLPFLHIFGGYKLIELDDMPLETETFDAGLGLDIELSANQSFFFDLSAMSVETELATSLGTSTADEDAYGASIGYRETKQTRLELLVRFDYVELADVDYSDKSLHVSMQYEVTPRFKVEGAINFGGDETYFLAGVRCYLSGLSGR